MDKLSWVIWINQMPPFESLREGGPKVRVRTEDHVTQQQRWEWCAGKVWGRGHELWKLKKARKWSSPQSLRRRHRCSHLDFSPGKLTADLWPSELGENRCVVFSHPVGGHLSQQPLEADTVVLWGAITGAWLWGLPEEAMLEVRGGEWVEFAR